MAPRTRERKQISGDLAAGHDDAPLRALGLWDFVNLPLLRPHHHLDLAATYDPSSGRIAVAGVSATIAASRADLATALSLPLRPTASTADATLFSSPEAIAAVRRVVSDRVLLRGQGGGDGGGGEELPDEAVEALCLVEEGKAHMVDWGGLLWAVVERELVMGKPHRYLPHLLRLIKCQRPELFADVGEESEADVEESFVLEKRKKGASLLEGRSTDVKVVDCKKAEVEEEGRVPGEGKKLRCRATGVADMGCKKAEVEEEGRVPAKSKKLRLRATGVAEMDCKKAEVEEEGLVPGKNKKIPCQATIVADMDCKKAEVEEGQVPGKSKMVWCCTTSVADVDCKKTEVEERVPGKSKKVWCRTTSVTDTDCKKAEVEERQVVGKSKKVADFVFQQCQPNDVMVADCNKAKVEEEGRILENSKEVMDFGLQKCRSNHDTVVDCMTSDDKGKGDDGGNADTGDCSSDNSSFLSLVRAMDCQDDSCSLQKMIFGTELRHGSNQPQIIEIDDANEDDQIDGIDPNVIRNGTCNLLSYLAEQQKMREGIRNDRSLSPFHACMEQAQAFMPQMEMVLLEKEKACNDTQMAIQHMKALVKEKDCIIAATKKAILEELQKRHIASCRLEQDMKAMARTIHQYKKALKKSFAAFVEYRRQFGECGGSFCGDVGMAGGRDCISREQELRFRFAQVLTSSQRCWLSRFTGCVDQFSGLTRNLVDLGDEVQRLQDST